MIPVAAKHFISNYLQSKPLKLICRNSHVLSAELFCAGNGVVVITSSAERRHTLSPRIPVLG
jgi:hypothetical protein